MWTIDLKNKQRRFLIKSTRQSWVCADFETNGITWKKKWNFSWSIKTTNKAYNPQTIQALVTKGLLAKKQGTIKDLSLLPYYTQTHKKIKGGKKSFNLSTRINKKKMKKKKQNTMNWSSSLSSSTRPLATAEYLAKTSRDRDNWASIFGNWSTGVAILKQDTCADSSCSYNGCPTISALYFTVSQFSALPLSLLSLLFLLFFGASSSSSSSSFWWWWWRTALFSQVGGGGLVDVVGRTSLCMFCWSL